MSRVDYPFNSKIKGVFYLFIEHTSIKSSWYKHLRECINFKLSIVRKLCAKSIPRQVRGLKAKISYLIVAPGDITLIQENTSQRKPVFWYIICSDNYQTTLVFKKLICEPTYTLKN